MVRFLIVFITSMLLAVGSYAAAGSNNYSVQYFGLIPSGSGLQLYLVATDGSQYTFDTPFNASESQKMVIALLSTAISNGKQIRLNTSTNNPTNILQIYIVN